MIRSQTEDEKLNKSKVEKILRQAARRELTFSVVVEALVISTEVGSF